MKDKNLDIQMLERREKKKRFDTVFGIYIAAIIGFVLNILADILQGWIFDKKSLSLFQTEVVAGLVLVLITAIIFLEFFIFDFRYELKFDQKFWSRFFNYFENKHWLSSRLTKIPAFVSSGFKWIFWVLLSFVFFIASFPVFIVWVLFTTIFNFGVRWAKKWAKVKSKIVIKNQTLNRSLDRNPSATNLF